MVSINMSSTQIPAYPLFMNLSFCGRPRFTVTYESGRIFSNPPFLEKNHQFLFRDSHGKNAIQGLLV